MRSNSSWRGILGEGRTGHHGILGRVGAIGDNEAWISHISRYIRFSPIMKVLNCGTIRAQSGA